MVHNHHNYAWREWHDGRDLWVVRKGATPAFPGQRGFVGGSMGDDAVIIEGIDSPEAKASLYSTIHGAGRLFGRKEAKRRLHPRRDGCVAAVARRDAGRRRSRRNPDGLRSRIPEGSPFDERGSKRSDYEGLELLRPPRASSEVQARG